MAKKTIEIPFLLIDAVKNRRTVLFLGAGASKECKNAKGNSPPDGNGLRDIISQKYMGKKMPTRNVQTVAEMAIENGAGQSLVFETVNNAFEGFEPSEAHRLLTDFYWRTIATTNYDLFVEEAYGDSKRRKQTLIPFVKDDEPVDERMRRATDPVQYLKLHGCLNHRLDKDIPLILSWEQYDQYSQNRTRLFGRLNDLAHEATMIFVGYALADGHVRQLIYRLSQKSRPRWYIIDPAAEDEDIKFWNSKNVEILKCRFGEFMKALDQALPKLLRFMTPAPEDSKFPIREYYAADIEESDAIKSAMDKDLLLIHASMAVAEQTAERFYSGYDTGFGAILKRLDARRKVTDDLLFKALLELEAPSGPYFFVLRGPGGAGKTIALKRAAFDAATANQALVLWLRETGQLRPEVFVEIADLVRRTIYLFVDQVALHVEKLIPFVKTMKTRNIPVVIIGAEREGDWATYCGPLEDVLVPQFLRVGTLRSTEVEDLLDKLQRNDCLGELKEKSRADQIAAFMSEEYADRQLLVALHVLTKGLPFEKIVMNEYDAVYPEQARRLYLDIATMNQFSVPVRAGTISRASGIDFIDYKEKFFEPLKDIISTNIDPYTQDYVYKTRHVHVAEIVFRLSCDDDSAKAKQFIHIVQGLDVGYSSDRRVLESICRGRTLVETFGDADLVRDIYRAAVAMAPKQAYLYQQWAIFESNHPHGDFLEAETLAATASDAEPRNGSFLHTRAEVARKRANRESSPVLKQQLRRMADKHLSKMQSGDRFAVSSRCKLLVDEVADMCDTLSDAERESDDRFFAEKLKEATAALARAQQDFPDDPEMFETEARLWSELKDKGRALKALERAWKKLPKKTGVAIRISKIHGAAGRTEEQEAILREALQRDPQDRETHFAMALYLLSRQPPDLEAAERHLRDSFVQSDQNFEARHTLAQLIFQKGNKDQAHAMFEEIDRRAPREFRRLAPKLDNSITKLLPTYRGTIETVAENFFFIRSGSFPHHVFAHRSAFDEAVVDDVQFGQQVTFRVRFNRKGPVAVEVIAI